MATIPSVDAAESVKVEPGPSVRPSIDHLVTEDDVPKDNILSEKQQRLLTEPLYSSWNPGRLFLATANVGLFFAVRQPPLVPDVLLSLDVEVPGDWLAKEHRSYFVWEFGKVPEAVVEIVSNTEGGETTDKMVKYAQIGILYYAIFDPARAVQSEALRVFVLRNTRYVPCPGEWLPALGLGLVLWRGRFEQCDVEWLRWCDREGRVIPTGAERAEQESQRADQARQRGTATRSGGKTSCPVAGAGGHSRGTVTGAGAGRLVAIRLGTRPYHGGAGVRLRPTPHPAVGRPLPWGEVEAARGGAIVGLVLGRIRPRRSGKRRQSCRLCRSAAGEKWQEYLHVRDCIA